MAKGHTVGEVAKTSHVSVRTLHHYDAIALLRPSGRSRAGYRLYTDLDLERLQQVLFYRELGFPLEDIARLLRDPKHDRRRALVGQRKLLAEKVDRMKAMLALVDKTLDAMEKGIAMNKEEMFEVFGEFDPKEHEDEAKRRWGKTDAYTESARRTKRYTKDDWKKIKAEADEILDAYGALKEKGAEASSVEAMDVAERARLHIDRWYYPCPRAMHAALGRMYVDDARFAAHYEKRAAGLAQFVHDAIAANAARA